MKDIIKSLLTEALDKTYPDVKYSDLIEVQNVTAKSQTAPDEIRRLLIEQVTNRVRWRESILFMRDNGVEMFIEIGAGKVLTGLTRRIDQSLKSISIQTPDDINAFLESL